MNCLEFRRTHDIEPNCQDRGFIAHSRECEACAGFIRRAARFERRLSAAMHIKPPEDLASKILVKQAFKNERPNDKPRAGSVVRWLLAASVVVAVGLAGWCLITTVLLASGMRLWYWSTRPSMRWFLEPR